MEEKDIRYRNIKRLPSRIHAILENGTKVEGCLHLVPNNRLIDQLNSHTKESPFIALTDARILLPDGGEWNHHEFFSININMITCCFPLEE